MPTPPKPLRGRQATDRTYLKALRNSGEWMRAEAIAAQIGLSRHTAAHALKRMVERGSIECRVVEVPGKGRVREETREYRARAAVGSLLYVERLLPAWLAPQAVVEFGVARRVAGRAGLSCQDENMAGPENGAANTRSASSAPSTPTGWGSSWFRPLRTLAG
jgi:hypothetical protein